MDIVFSKNGVKCAVFIDSDVQSYIRTLIIQKIQKSLELNYFLIQ